MTERRARAAIPTAAHLIAAVAARDAAEIERLLRSCGDLHALAVVLASQAVLPKSLPTGVEPVLTAEQRRAAHNRYFQGCRDAQTVLGEREYQRESKRRRRELAEESPPVLEGGHWVTRSGVRMWIDDDQKEAG